MNNLFLFPGYDWERWLAQLRPTASYVWSMSQPSAIGHATVERSPFASPSPSFSSERWLPTSGSKPPGPPLHRPPLYCPRYVNNKLYTCHNYIRISQLIRQLKTNKLAF